MPDITENNRNKWRKFVIRNLLLYLIPNVTLNTLIPYFALQTQTSVHLFTGDQNLARFLLPMSLLLPFLITIDVCKKIKALQNNKNLHFECSDIIEGKAKMFRLAGLHSLYTVAVMVLVLVLLYVSFPVNFNFGIIFSAALAGSLAGFYSIAFFFLSLKKIREIPMKAD